MRYPTAAQVVRDVIEAGTTMPRDFKNVKIEDICNCRATARQRMVKRMVRRDSAHRIGLVRHALCPANYSGSISIWGNLLSQDSEF